MRRVLLGLLLLSGCAIDILGDPEPDRCPGTDLDYCVPADVSVRVTESYTDLEPGTDPVLARGGLAPLFVDGGGSQEEMSWEVTGGELTQEDVRNLTLRALEETVTVVVEVGGQEDDLVLTSHPVDAIQVAPVEQQFLLAEAAGPIEFAQVRGSLVPMVMQLVGGDARLIDTSLVATGAAVADQSRWDFLEVDASVEPVAISIAGDSGAVEVEIATAAPEVDSIEVVSGPQLSDPDQPITLSPAGEAAICFTGLSGGRQLAGLEWDIQGAGVSTNDGCAYVDTFTSTLSVSAGGVTRSFDLDIEAP